jgi:hypothetical protein
MTDPLEERAGELIGIVRGLEETIRRANDVRTELDDLVARAKRNRRVMIAVIAGFTLDVVLTVLMVFVTARVNHVVQVQHDGALCPLYRIFIESDTQANRDRAAAQGQDMAVRERQFVIIRRSYDALNCEAK